MKRKRNLKFNRGYLKLLVVTFQRLFCGHHDRPGICKIFQHKQKMCSCLMIRERRDMKEMETCRARGRSHPGSSPPEPCPSGWSHRLQRVRPPWGGSRTPRPAPASSPPPAAARTCARAWIRFDSFFLSKFLQVTSTFVAHGVRKNWFHLRGGAVKAFLMHLNLWDTQLNMLQTTTKLANLKATLVENSTDWV